MLRSISARAHLPLDKDYLIAQQMYSLFVSAYHGVIADDVVGFHLVDTLPGVHAREDIFLRIILAQSSKSRS
jgi:hypothetical protein